MQRDERWRAVRVVRAGDDVAGVLAAGCAPVTGAARPCQDDELTRLEGWPDEDRSPYAVYSRLAAGQLAQWDRWAGRATLLQVCLAERFVLDGWDGNEACVLAEILRPF